MVVGGIEQGREDPLQVSAGNQLAMLVVPARSSGGGELGRILLATNF